MCAESNGPTKSIVLAFFLDASSHQVSHQSHSWGSDLIGTWWIMLLGRSWEREKNTHMIALHTDKAISMREVIQENNLRENVPPGPDWTGCWGLDSDPGTGLSVCLQLRSSWTFSDQPHREHWGTQKTPNQVTFIYIAQCRLLQSNKQGTLLKR